VFRLGPLSVHAYGVCIALGVIAAVALASRRWVAEGHSADDMSAVALWAVPAGVVGARIYHVVTDYQLFADRPVEALYIWKGGLGIWGGIAAGVGAALLVGRRRRLPLGNLLNAAAPALPLAQAIGRFGNYFNQELFGRPTSVPWAVEIDPDNRPGSFLEAETFHPTFLYEALWNLALCLALIAISKRWKPAPGRLFAMYVSGYTLGRFFIEGLRIDTAHHFLGLRLNQWTSAILFTAFTGFLIIDGQRRRASGQSAGSTGSS